MAPVPPPIKIGDVATGNTFQGCCATVIAEDNARIVFSNRHEGFETRERTVSLFNHVRCCIWGETKSRSENRRTQRKLAVSLKMHDGLEWEDVKEKLFPDLEETDVITWSMFQQIEGFRLQQKKVGEDENTSRIMSLASFPAATAFPDQLKSSDSPEPVPVFVEQAQSKPANQRNVKKVAKKSGLLPTAAAPARKFKSSSVVPPIPHWEEQEKWRARNSEDFLTRRFLDEVARYYSNQDMSPLKIEKVLRDFREFVQNEEEKQRLMYEQKVGKLVEAVQKKMSEKGGEMALSSRTVRDVVENVLAADHELCEEMQMQSPVHFEGEWLNEEIENVNVSEHLKEHLSYSHSPGSRTGNRLIERVEKKASETVGSPEKTVTSEEVILLFRRCIERTPPGESGSKGSSSGKIIIEEMEIAPD